MIGNLPGAAEPRGLARPGLLLVLALALPLPGLSDPTPGRLVLYAAYASDSECFLWGRALEDKDRKDGQSQDSALRNLRRSLGDFESDELQELPLIVEVDGSAHRVQTDGDGFFRLTLPAPGSSSERVRDSIEVLIRQADGFTEHRIPPIATRVARIAPGSTLVISDVDDTIMKSSATDKSKLLRKTLFENAATIEPVPGMATLYSKLKENAEERTSFFYLSGSPVNLHDRIRSFLGRHGFPDGSVLLKNLGGAGSDSLTDQSAHKLAHLEQLAKRLPRARFLLFGDSGQEDAGIYGTFAKRHPDRVLGIFIRLVPDIGRPESAPSGITWFTDPMDTVRAIEERAGADRSQQGDTSGLRD